MTGIMDICRGYAFDEMDLLETSSEDIHEAAKRSLDEEPTVGARLVSTELASDLDEISIEESSRLVTGGRSDIFEEYDILPAVLGVGQHGRVRECRRRSTGEMFAVKTIDKSRVPLDYLKREIDLLCCIDHPAIMKTEGCYEDDYNVHIVTERYTGGELFDRIVSNVSGRGCLPEDQAAGIVRSLLEAVRYLHSKDIVHRDIKPENVLFESSEEGSPVRLIDFGFSCRHGPSDAPMRNGVGTSYYMSPAVLRGKYDRSCDVWAVGVVAYILLCGYPPFNGSDDYKVEMSVLRGDLVFKQGIWGNLSAASKDFVGRLLGADSSRIGTASEALRHPWLAGA